MIWGGADVIIIEIKCAVNVNKWNALESSWSHCLPPSMEKLSSMKPIPGAKRVGAHCSRGLNHHTSSCAQPLQSCPTLCHPWTVARQAPLSMGFSRQEPWSGVAVPSSRGSSRPRNWTHVSRLSCTVAGSLPTEPSGKPPTSSYPTFKTLLKSSFPPLTASSLSCSSGRMRQLYVCACAPSLGKDALLPVF